MTDHIAPLVPEDCDLRDFQFMPVDVVRLFGSRFHAITNDSEWRAGVTLWLKSFHQVPAASLPDDDIELCRLAELGRDFKAWRKIKENALHGWIKCADGRWYHPVVAEKANEAWEKKRIQRMRSQKGNAARWGFKDSPGDQSGSGEGLQSGQKTDPKDVPQGNQEGSQKESLEESLKDRKGQGQGQGQLLTTSDEVVGDSQTNGHPKGIPDCPHQDVIALYHAKLPTCPKVREWHETRAGYLRSRWREKGAKLGWKTQQDGLAWFDRFFGFVAQSRFLTGQADGRNGQPPFCADLEWMLRPTNFAKIVEGKYS